MSVCGTAGEMFSVQCGNYICMGCGGGYASDSGRDKVVDSDSDSESDSDSDRALTLTVFFLLARLYSNSSEIPYFLLLCPYALCGWSVDI